MLQRKYVTEMLKKFHMKGCNAAETPADMNVKLESFTEEEKVDPTLFRKKLWGV